MIDLGLDGKRAVVSWAGYIPTRAGHGRASSLRLAAAGATVACVDIDEGRAQGVVGAQGTLKYQALLGEKKPADWPGPGRVYAGFSKDDGQWDWWQAWLRLMVN